MGEQLALYPVRLPEFEGPLDLLLHLIRENRLNIYDIPIAEITRQYLEYLEFMKTLDIKLAGEFLVMAATLLHIKSRMLLPKPDPPEEEDPRLEIVRPLVELLRFREAAEALEERPVLYRDVFPRGISLQEYDQGPTPVKASLFDLISALRDLLKRNRPPEILEVRLAKVSVKEKLDQIWHELILKGRLLFKTFVKEASRVEIIACFLALLELARQERIFIIQVEPFGEIEVVKR
ncbi:segregation and condensation protein A [Thermosulfuriphilus sp.]